MKCCDVKFPRAATPKRPFHVILNLAARVEVNEKIETIPMLHKPLNSFRIKLIWNEERVLCCRKRTIRKPCCWIGANSLLLWMRISRRE